MPHKIFAADIGGSNSRFARFGLDPEGGLELESSIWLKTGEADSFGALLAGLKDKGFSPGEADAACIAVAGPVRGMTARPPAIDWDVDVSEPGTLGLPARTTLINDFIAQAYACITRPGDEAVQVLAGEPDPGGTMAVMGPGTGLGKSALVPCAGGYAPMPSEGGHAAFPFTFPFRGKEEIEFSAFVLERAGGEYVTLDSVVTGRGLAWLHEFLTGEILPPEEIEKGSKTYRTFAGFLGRAARDFALDTLATGGLFITGGVAARNPEAVISDEFRQEFLSSPKMRDVLMKIPVKLITDQDAGLWGAAECASLSLGKAA